MGSTGGGCVGILMYQLMPALFHASNSITSESFRVEKFQLPLAVLGELCITSSYISFISSMHVSGRTSNISMQTSDSYCDLLFGGSLASYCSQHVGRCSLSLSHGKESC